MNSKFETNHPAKFGYYWIKKNEDACFELYKLTPSKQFTNDNRSVEIWECPGIGRTYLDWNNFPSWQWIPIELPANSS